MGDVMIFTDSYYNQDPSKASKEPLNTPKNKREMPCEGCANYMSCMDNLVECNAFRKWSLTGNYTDEQVGRYMRTIK